jgi:hypothetical protein
MKELKALAIRVGLIVFAALLLAIVLGFVVSHGVGVGAVKVLRDLSVLILAFLTLVSAAIWAAIYLGAAWGVGRYGGLALRGLRWAGTKVLWVEGRVDVGMERFILRPLARSVRVTVTGATLGRTLLAGPDRRLDFRHELTQWRTRVNRLRGRAFTPPAPYEPAQRGQRDIQPGPGISV